MMEREIAVAIVAEPVHIPETNWAGSTDKRAAIFWRPDILRTQCKIASTGRGFVALCYSNIVIFSCYISPNISRNEFEEILEEIDFEIKRLKPENFLVCGDFNSKSIAWGSLHTCPRGESLEDWALLNDLILMNTGNIPTCTRSQGDSHVDVTWANTTMMQSVRDWKVHEDIFTYSDHNYIEFCMGDITRRKETLHRRMISINKYPRWITKDIDAELLAEVIDWQCTKFLDETEMSHISIDVAAKSIKQMMTEASDAVMRRAKIPSKKKQMYWWNGVIKAARTSCIKARRLWTREKRKKIQNGEKIRNLEQNYRLQKKDLSTKIHKAKEESWETLINMIEEDPWGIPYKMVMGKLRSNVPNITETLSYLEITRLLHDLFPRCKDKCPKIPMGVWKEEWDITEAEVHKIVRARTCATTAPGPDGITNKVWKKTPDKMIQILAKLFTECLKRGEFPNIWKCAKLVLIPKGNKFEDGLPKARPICLIDEIGKALERIIVDRIYTWIEERKKDRFYILCNNQYGFRKNRSTIDVLAKVRGYIEEETGRGNVVIAISLDVRNAFNSIPWKSIRRSLFRKKFPRYIRRILHNYLSDRYIEYINQDGKIQKLKVEAGVPQGSVLGPLLWNIAYDPVLRIEKEPGCDIYCYADDTLILVTGNKYDAARERASMMTERVLDKIREIGLQVAIEKTEVVAFYKSRVRPTTGGNIQIGRTEIPIKTSMKYLGVILDSKLNFEEHFKYVGQKLSKTTRALCRILPNLRGPHESKRRLYAHTIQAIAMYGAPIWSDKLKRSVSSQRILIKAHRVMAIKIIAGYRTISYDAATVLARTPPWILVAEKYRKSYLRIQEERRQDTWTIQIEKQIKQEEDNDMMQRWETLLRRRDLPSVGLRRAIADSFTAWMTRSFGGMNFHLTQLLSDHGCFQKFLYRIKKANSPMCTYCKDTQDNAEHTMMTCRHWETERIHMMDTLKCNVTLGGIIKAACESKDKWMALNHFAQEVMNQKENLERESERERESGNRGTQSPSSPSSQVTRPRQRQNKQIKRGKRLHNILEKDSEEEEEEEEEDRNDDDTI